MSLVVHDVLTERRCCEEERKEGKKDHGYGEMRVGEGQEDGQACKMGRGQRKEVCWQGGEADAEDVGDENECCVCPCLLVTCFSDRCTSVQLRPVFFATIFYTATIVSSTGYYTCALQSPVLRMSRTSWLGARLFDYCHML